MNWAEVRRLAEGSGWVLLRHGSRHDIYHHPSRSDVLLIERHSGQEVRRGLLKKVLKQIGK